MSKNLFSGIRVGMLAVALLGLLAAASPTHAGVEPESVCKDKKVKATGRKALDKLKAYGKDTKTHNVAKLSSDLSKAESKFEKGFTKAEFKGNGSPNDCPTFGDAAAIETKVDDFVRDLLCDGVGQETITIPSGAEPAETPGTAGVDNSDYPKLVTMFGGTSFSLNNATYTRYFCGGAAVQPDAILILVPGFEGGASNFKALAENSIPRARASGLRLEVWAFDRRGHQMEDREGLKIARDAGSALAGLDWYFGAELGLTLDPLLVAGPNRRAVFHNTTADTAFMANWTNLAFSRDIDAVVDAARSTAVNQNVFLGGHSAGTGFTARYASTDLNLTGVGSPDPGYAKLRGLVLLEGSGGSTGGTPPTAAQLDEMEDKFDGGLFGAIKNNQARCADGTTFCTGDSDCTGIGKGTCTEPIPAYAIVQIGMLSLLNPRILASAEPGAIQGRTDPDGGQVILQVDQGGAGNNAVAVVPDLAALSLLPQATAEAALGSFIDDDGFISSFATFVRTSVGAPGPTVGGLLTWRDITEGPFDATIVPNNGPPPSSGGAVWGQEVEVVEIRNVGEAFITGDTNFTDWYYPSSGPTVTTGLGLDSTLLSADSPTGRARRDIENLTQAANVDIPVICFGGSNGLAAVPGAYVPFGQSIGTCTAPSCDGSTVRVVDAANPSASFPTFGGVAGGYEVHISEGYAHIDVVAAVDGEHNQVIGPLVDFLVRNVQ